MAIYKLFPSKDATMYSKYPEKNTGLDEILELTIDQTDPNNPYVSRFLIQFDNNEINNICNNYIDGNNYSAYLRCYNAETNGLPGIVDLQITTVNDDPANGWDMGTGKYLYDPQYTNGVSWTYKKNPSIPWPTTSQYDYQVEWDNVPGGGSWFTSSNYKFTQTLDYYSNKDINIDVTDTVDGWYNSDIANNGFLVRIFEDVYYYGVNNAPSLKYFSRDTHTIYPPCLEFRWEDATDTSDNIEILNTLPAVISIDNNPGVFYPSSINQFRVNSRPEYPARAFQTSSYYTLNYGLPYGDSCYAIKDLDTNEYVIDFDNQYTQLSLDDNGSYFTLYMNGLEPERYYSIIIKTIIDNNTLVFDTNYNFKVING